MVDDGAGVDVDAVARRALAAGLSVPAPAAELDGAELWALMSAEGLSTAAEVSPTSGRGVGLDVVEAAVRSLRGRAEVETMAGEGSVVTLRIPMALAVTYSLFVAVEDQIFAVPALAVARTDRVDAAGTPRDGGCRDSAGADSPRGGTPR